MKNIIKSSLLVFIILSFNKNALADSYITIHLSYKVVLNPATGNRPFSVIDSEIESAVGEMNSLMEAYGRGYRFTIDEILDIGWQGGWTSGPSQWYNTDFHDANNGSNWKNQMESEAMDNNQYFWQNDAINIYITDGICGGKCSFPNSEEIIIIGSCADGSGVTLLHEIGHFFDLCHTQGCYCGDCEGDCQSTPGNDEIDDTLPDLPCWDLNNISDWNFQSSFNNLTPNQQNQVLNVFNNIMSYHNVSFTIARLTEGQLDRWADIMDNHQSRRNVRSGDSWFVKVNGSFFGNGSAGNPYNHITLGLNAANSNGKDIIYFRPGTYQATSGSLNYTITKPATLRSTRAGSVIIQ